VKSHLFDQINLRFILKVRTYYQHKNVANLFNFQFSSRLIKIIQILIPISFNVGYGIEGQSFAIKYSNNLGEAEL
jgi:hypothetical protein